MDVRVRYAPSPTGLQHIGGVRTALFNYFFAKANKGKFILRIEDTDQGRYTEESLQDLYDTFNWLGIKWEEGPDVGGKFAPYTQSERVELYREYAKKLIDSGDAYYCFCSEERLENLREEQKNSKSKIQGYDRHCRDLSKEEQGVLLNKFQQEGKTPVIRFKTPLRGETVLNDILLGEIKRKNEDISPDPILLKADRFPTYHLANVVDDHFMEITHILRAQEWIPTGPLHILLYKAFGWQPPQYCHLPMVMGKDGQKLSKRHGSTSAKEFREAGYLPEAVINYVTMVGWSYDDKTEFFTKDELEKVFSIDKINKAPGVFDYKKLDWFNGQYIRKLTEQDLKEKLIPYLQKVGFMKRPISATDDKILTDFIPLLQPRLKKLEDVVQIMEFLFVDKKLEDKTVIIPKNLTESDTKKILNIILNFLEDFFCMSEEEAEEKIRVISTDSGYKLGDIMSVFRVAITKSLVSPPIFETARILGKEQVISKIIEAKELF